MADAKIRELEAMGFERTLNVERGAINSLRISGSRVVVTIDNGLPFTMAEVSFISQSLARRLKYFIANYDIKVEIAA